MPALSMASPKHSWWYVRRAGTEVILVPQGRWRLANLSSISLTTQESIAVSGTSIVIEGNELTDLDTAGALILFKLALGDQCNPQLITLRGFSPRHYNVATLVQQRWNRCTHPLPIPSFTMVQHIGERSIKIYQGMKALAAFVGETFHAFLSTLLNPRLLRKRELFVQLEQVCVDAIPIVCLVTALIGIVVAYLFAMQLVKYGANIFIVDGVVLAMSRELAPIIVAITLAGRSGSAFTAQLGTMKINEEIDAMVTSGLSPQQVLVIPRILALMIALPLLTFLGIAVGTLGGLVIADWYVGITPATFLDRIQTYFPYKSFYLGIAKAPVFAAFVATIGCKMGLSVENNARSVGDNTTSTVVQSIVSIIILDALFAVLFAKIGFY